MDEIFAMLEDYSKRNIIFTRKAIERILNILLQIDNLQRRVSYEISRDEIISLDNLQNKNILAEFDMDSVLYVYYREILKSIYKKKYLSKYDTNLSKIAIAFKKNIMIIETIFHEIEHANELVKIQNVYDGHIATQIYRYEYDYQFATDDIGMIEFIKRSIIFRRCYNISFMERMAEITALERTGTLLEPLDGELAILKENERKIKEDFILKEYQNGLSGPTTKFLSCIDCLKDFNDSGYMNVIRSMPFEERLRYGFGITESEYKKVKKI